MDRCEQFAHRRRARGVGRRGPPRGGSGTARRRRSTTGIGGIGSILAAYDTLREKGWQRISPFTVPMLMPNGPAGRDRHGARRPAGAHSVVSACASGAEAIGYGIDMIRSGRADVVLAGGTEAAIMPLNVGAFAVDAGACPPATTSRSAPHGRSTRAGTASCSARAPASLVLESLEHAQPRGARVYAVAAGAGIHLRRAPHRAAGPRRRRGDGRRSRRRWPTRASTRRRSCTSTRTPPRPRPATRSRRRR